MEEQCKNCGWWVKKNIIADANLGTCQHLDIDNYVIGDDEAMTYFAEDFGCILFKPKE